MTIIGNNITISLKDGKDIVKDFNFVLNDNDIMKNVYWLMQKGLFYMRLEMILLS